MSPDPRIAYPIGQTLAQDVLGSGGNGLLYQSIRRDGGRCLVAFRTQLVQNIRQGDTWIFEWTRRPIPDISRA